MWDDSAQNSFEELKLKMTQAPVLAMPNFAKSFELEADAFNHTIGAIFNARQSPNCFF